MESNRKYILLFIIIFLFLMMFVFLFFYFNVYILFGMLVLILILSIIYLSKNGSNNKKENIYYDIESQIEDDIENYIDNFNLDSFYSYVKEVIKLISNSYSKNNINMLNEFLGKDLIKKTKKNLDEYSSNNTLRIISGVKIRDLKLYNFYSSFGYYYLELEACISKIDCFVKDGVVVNGDKNIGSYKNYNLVFCKKNDDYTPNIIDKCPSCGSEKSNFSGGKCMNCHNLVVNENGFYLIKINEK